MTTTIEKGVRTIATPETRRSGAQTPIYVLGLMVPTQAAAQGNNDETSKLIADREFMCNFAAGVRDLEAGRRISADDLERELGL